MTEVVLEQILSEDTKLIGIVCAFMLVLQIINIVKMKALSRRIYRLEHRDES